MRPEAAESARRSGAADVTRVGGAGPAEAGRRDRAGRSKVVIIGAGFGGLAAARGLAGADVDVTIVDRHNFHTFQPLLYQVATAGLNTADVANAVRGMFHGQANVDFRQAMVLGVDWERHRLRLAAGAGGGAPAELGFDHLVVATGSTTNYFGIVGAAEHAFPLYGLADAVRLRNHVLARFEAAAADPSLIDDGALTFVVVGGGPTGVETAGALAELFAMVLRKDYRHLDVGRARIVLVEMLDSLLAPFSGPSQRHAREALEERGVEVRLGEAVTEISATRVLLRSGEELPSQTLIWAAGVKASPLAAALRVTQGPAGRVVVEPDLSVPGHPDAWVVGDLAHVVGPDCAPLPQLAPVAMQAGAHVAAQIRARLEHRPTAAFSYRDKGTMATIGRRAAVAELPFRIRLRGTAAWFAWLGLHLVFLVGTRNRVSVFVNWAWNYFTWDRGPRLILDQQAVTDALDQSMVVGIDDPSG
ncbi:NAD(P)/FAD-dependent oxidoreductase [soil metagenome]